MVMLLDLLPVFFAGDLGFYDVGVVIGALGLLRLLSSSLEERNCCIEERASYPVVLVFQ